jgi:maltose/moltooligosaccharide transporter
VALTLDLAINVGFNHTRSIIADLTPEGEARTMGFAWMQTISGLFGVLAYVVGAVFGNGVLIFFGVALVLVFNVVPALLLQEPRELGEGTGVLGHGEAAGPAGGTKAGRLMHICVAHGFTWLGVQTMFVYMFAYARWAFFPGVGDLSEARKMELGQVLGRARGQVQTQRKRQNRARGTCPLPGLPFWRLTRPSWTPLPLHWKGRAIFRLVKRCGLLLQRLPLKT